MTLFLFRQWQYTPYNF